MAAYLNMAMRRLKRMRFVRMMKMANMNGINRVEISVTHSFVCVIFFVANPGAVDGGTVTMRKLPL